MTEWYLSLKLLHLLSAMLLFGTGLGTAFYMWRADHSGDARVIAAVSRNVVRADWLFTAPAVILQPLTGIGMAHIAGLPLSLPWIAASLVLYALVGLCWLPVVWLQIRIAEVAAACSLENAELPDAYRRYMRWWYRLGWPALIMVVGIIYLMVFKPTF